MKRKKMYFDKLSGLEKWVTDKQVEIVGLIALGTTRTTNTATWPYHTCESLSLPRSRFRYKTISRNKSFHQSTEC
jgi:hypothetical protein